MKNLLNVIIICCLALQTAGAQDFGNLPKIEKEKLLGDLEILYQGLDKFHSGMYWYTPKDSVDRAFADVRKKITKDLNVLEFHKLIAPFVALSREDHTDIFRPAIVKEKINSEVRLLPLRVVFLGKQLYCVKNGSDFQDFALEGQPIESINGETPERIVGNIGNLFASDGYIKAVKYSDLEGLSFPVYHFYYYGQVDQFEIKFKGISEPITLQPLTIKEIARHLNDRYGKPKNTDEEVLEYQILNDSVAYLGIHTFGNGEIRAHSDEKKLSVFLRNSFKSIRENDIQTLIVDVSKNTGGSEGNEGLLYSYFGDNYQKYKKVRVKAQKAVLDNGTDKPITLKAFGFFERLLTNRKMALWKGERHPAKG